MPVADSTTGIEAVFRIEFARLVAGLTRFVDDVGLAEEPAQDALVDALVPAGPSPQAPRRPRPNRPRSDHPVRNQLSNRAGLGSASVVSD